MWIQLLCASLLAIVFLIVPGFLLARALGARSEFAFGVAPIVTLTSYGILSIAYGVLGIPCGWLTLFALVAIIGLVLNIVRRRSMLRGGSQSHAVEFGFSADLERPFRTTGILQYVSPIRLALILAVAAGIATSLAVYVMNIGDPNAYIQNYDNAFHLSRIHMFAQEQNYSTFAHGGFYPSAWHGIAAMVESTLGVSSMMAEHAANLAFIIGVFPVGSVVLLGVLFPHRTRAVWMGGMLCLSFGFFPWRIMLFGPLYPNLSAFALMPTVAALFILLWKRGLSASIRGRYALLFVFGGVAMALAQPNAIFSTGAFLIPFCVWRMYRFVYDARENRRHRVGLAILAAVALALVFVAFWVLLSQAPFMHGVVYYPRETRLGIGQAIRWALGFSFVIKRQQYLIGVVVVLGGVVLLTRPRVRWVSVSYALLVMLFAVSISVSGIVRNVLAGFWYNDFYRLAATTCVFAVPMVATGMDAVASAVERGVGFIRKKLDRGSQSASGERLQDEGFAIDAAASTRPSSRGGVWGHVAAAIVVVTIMAFNYIPFEFIPHFYRSYGLDAVSYEMRDMYQNPNNCVFDADEVAFVERVKDIVPAGETVFNVPFDGSVFAYAACNLDVAYSSFGHEPSEEAIYLREDLCNIASDQTARYAAQKTGVHYVLQLDQGSDKNGFNENGSVYLLGYVPKEWRGVTSISDDTPGFECVLAEGDMRLYRINE